MKRSNPRRAPKYRLGLAATLVLAVVLAGFLTVLCLWVQPNSLRALAKVLRAQPLLIVLNALPVGLTLLALTALFGNLFTAAGVTGALWSVLSLINRIKLEVRDEPLFPRDFALIKEAATATGDYAIQWPWGVIAVIFVTAAALIVLGAFVGCKPLPWARLRGLPGRALGCAAGLGVLAALVLTVYASNDLYNSFAVSNAYYIPSVFNELGFPYCFCHHFTTYTVDKPEGYSRAEAESWETGDQPGQGAAVNVIFVMNEAFSDITDDPAFTYTEETDPLQNLHALQNDGRTISGHIVVPGFAGGTANTEFDVTTGMQTNAISSTTTSAFRAVNRNLDSLFRVFAADGYHTSFFHPGDDWFYNRENVYAWLGAEETVFADQMEGLDYKGRWVTDDYMAGYIEQKFEEAMDSGELLFNYTTTIQNHMSYTADKYGEGYVFPAVETDAELSETAETLLSVYIEGVRDADAMLGRLTEYFAACGEPVVLVYYGDHLPYLGDDQLAYRELGSEVSMAEEERERTYCSYETPYVIWANDEAAAAIDWETAAAALDLPDNGSISACYLGQVVLELTGRGEASPWFQYLGQVRRELPVIQKSSAARMDGTVVKLRDLTEPEQDLVSKLRRWSYYKLQQKDVG